MTNRKLVRILILGEGRTDRRLFGIVEWLTRAAENCDVAIEFDHTIQKFTSGGVPAKVLAALERYEFDILIFHKDADSVGTKARREEILSAASNLRDEQRIVPCVPDREQEAWLLFDESSIRAAANNPRGRVALNIPKPSRLHTVSDPKAALHNTLRTASDAAGRRRRGFDVEEAVDRLAQLIQDWSPLEAQESFRDFSGSLRARMTELGCASRIA